MISALSPSTPLEKRGLCVLCMVLNPGPIHGVSMSPKDWALWLWVPIGAQVFECLGEAEIKKIAYLQWARGKRQRPHGVFVGTWDRVFRNGWEAEGFTSGGIPGQGSWHQKKSLGLNSCYFWAVVSRESGPWGMKHVPVGEVSRAGMPTEGSPAESRDSWTKSSCCLWRCEESPPVPSTHWLFIKCFMLRSKEI